MNILVTAFDPFGGDQMNPALEVAKKLPKEIKGAKVQTLEIPTVFNKGAEKIINLLEEKSFDLVLSLGQAGGRACMSVEFVGINWQDARIPDNEGQQPVNQKIDEEGPDAYFSNLTVRAMVEKMKEAGVPSQLSYTAGTFVCNDVFYAIRNYCEKNQKPILSGFIHLPYAPSQVAEKKQSLPSMEIETMKKGVVAALEAIVENKAGDVNISMGQLD